MAKYRSKALAEKRKKNLIINSIFIIAFLVSVNYLLSEISKIKKINISEINIKNNITVKTEEIEKIISSDIEGNYFWKFYSKRNILLYPKQNIKENLLTKYSEIKTVDLNLDLPNTLNIFIEEYKPYALWCGEDCYFIDNTGYIFKKTIKNENLFKYNINLNTKHLDYERNRVFKEEKFKEIDSFVQLIKGLNLSPEKIVSEDNKKYEIYFNNGSKVIFTNEQNTRELMDNFQAILNLEDFDIKSVEYVDLRFGNKVFYK